MKKAVKKKLDELEKDGKPKTHTKLLKRVAIEGGFSIRFVENCVGLYLANLRDHVWEKRKLRVPDLGTFKVKPMKARAVQPPPGQDGTDPIEVPAMDVVTFRAAKNFRTRT